MTEEVNNTNTTTNSNLIMNTSTSFLKILKLDKNELFQLKLQFQSDNNILDTQSENKNKSENKKENKIKSENINESEKLNFLIPINAKILSKEEYDKLFNKNSITNNKRNFEEMNNQKEVTNKSDSITNSNNINPSSSTNMITSNKENPLDFQGKKKKLPNQKINTINNNNKNNINIHTNKDKDKDKDKDKKPTHTTTQQYQPIDPQRKVYSAWPISKLEDEINKYKKNIKDVDEENKKKDKLNNEIEKFSVLFEKWLKISQDAVCTILEMFPQNPNQNYEKNTIKTLIDYFKIDPELIKFDSENECFEE